LLTKDSNNLAYFDAINGRAERESDYSKVSIIAYLNSVRNGALTKRRHKENVDVSKGKSSLVYRQAIAPFQIGG